MLIPHGELEPATLHAIVEEFVTRDGTDHSDVGPRIASVLSQLETGRATIDFDEENETCNIITAE